MTRVKICGLTRLYDIDFVNAARPDYIGFVFAKSRRRVSPAEALTLRERLAPGILPVGVFVNEKIETVLSVIQSGAVDLVQLHGLEDEDYVRRLKSLTGARVIKAVSVSSAWERSLGGAADYLLLDSAGGGTGRRFDWSLIGETAKPFFLAGGLNPENVTEALAKVKPFAVDVSSGVETDGYKDAEKIYEFINNVRKASV